MNTHVWFTRTHWAVGQGFFHSGEVRTGSADALYVYDCGSLDALALEREIDAFLASYQSQRIDLLFVSHYHYDHVSGIERLLREMTVQNVVIPVLAPIERLVAFAATAPDMALASWALDFAADPVEAIRRLAPNANVIQIQPDEEDAVDDRPAPDNQFPEFETAAERSENLRPTTARLRIGPTSVLEFIDSLGGVVSL